MYYTFSSFTFYYTTSWCQIRAMIAGCGFHWRRFHCFQHCPVYLFSLRNSEATATFCHDMLTSFHYTLKSPFIQGCVKYVLYAHERDVLNLFEAYIQHNAPLLKVCSICIYRSLPLSSTYTVHACICACVNMCIIQH